MTRVPLRAAAHIAGVRPGTIRRWVHDGRIRRHWNGYDLAELVAARDSRSLAALAARAGIQRQYSAGLR